MTMTVLTTLSPDNPGQVDGNTSDTSTFRTGVRKTISPSLSALLWSGENDSFLIPFSPPMPCVSELVCVQTVGKTF